MAQVRAKVVTDQLLQSGYIFNERRITEKVDSAGRTVHRSEKLLEVYPGLPGEPAYRRLIEEDGHPVPAETLASADRKRQQAVDSYAHELTTSAGMQKDAERRQQDGDTIDDVFRVYDMQFVGRETLEGDETIVATLTPKADAHPRTDDGKMMLHFHGRAWISEREYEVVRVDVEAIDDVSIGWGLFARVHKGAEAIFQRRKMNDEAWLPTDVTWTASARVFLLKTLRERGSSQFFGYRKFDAGAPSTFTAARR